MLALLHDFKRQIDAGEIVGQVDAELGCDQSGFQRSRQIESDYAAEFGNRRDPQGGIEVAMKFNLWEGFEIDGHLQLRNNDVNYGAGDTSRKSRSLAMLGMTVAEKKEGAAWRAPASYRIEIAVGSRAD